MHGSRFDVLTRDLAAGHSRRSLARLLAAAVLSGPMAVLWSRATAAKKKKRKKRKKRPVTAPPPPPPPPPGCARNCAGKQCGDDGCGGSCGTPCSFPHAAASCVAGQCTMGACDPGFADCNGDPGDGCEVRLGTASHCSGCGDACAPGDVCAASTTTCSPAYQFAKQWGGLSNCVQPDCNVPGFDGKFNKPTDLAFDADDNVFVVDWDNERVQKFTSGGVFLTRFGASGTGEQQFSGPYGIEVAADGVVHVADYANNRIQRWVQNNANPLQFDFAGNWGAFGTQLGKFNQPLFIAQDSQGNFYISDSLNNRVQKFSSTGTPLSSFGEAGTGDGKFDRPYGIAVDSHDDVFVVDYGNHRVQKFSSGGTFITKWGSSGDLPGKFVLPQGIAVDSFDDVFVADTNNHRVQKFTRVSGNPESYAWVTTIGTFGVDDPGEFQAPAGVGLDGDDNLYVADTYNHRIQKFAPVLEAASQQVSSHSGVAGQADVEHQKDGSDRRRVRGNRRKGRRR